MHISRTINSIFSSNTWTIHNELSNYVWLVDAGDVENIIRKVESDNKKIIGALLTHAHFDHIYGLNTLLEHNPDLVVYVGQEDKEALYSAKMNMSRYHEGGEFIFGGNNVCVVNDREYINLWEGISAEIIAAPGHTPGCVAYRVGEYLFTGDAYIPNYKVVTVLPRANKKNADTSWSNIDKLLKLRKFVLCSGH